MNHSDLKEVIHYNLETGVMTWKLPVANRIKTGDVAGWKSKCRVGKTYLYLETRGETYSQHRLAWFYVTGKWPKGEIDHEDGDGTNNRWLNLRDIPQAENKRNAKLRHDNKSGTPGVIWHKRDKKWEAYINHNNKRKYLGKHDLLNDAVIVRKNAELKYGFHKNHGSVRPL